MDTLSREERSERMSRVKSKGSKAEMIVRRLVHGLGYRYRLHATELPGKPDLVFRPRKKTIFVHGCFWHRHQKCSLARLPKSRLDFWLPKLEGNRKRDIRNQRQLKSMGWEHLIIWECEINEGAKLQDRIIKFLEADSKGGK